MGTQTPVHHLPQSVAEQDGYAVVGEWSQVHFPAPQYLCLVGLSQHCVPRHQFPGPDRW